MTTQPIAHTPTWSELTVINHDKAWKVLCRLDRGDLILLFARALKSTKPNDLESIFADYARPNEVGDVEMQAPKPLLEATRDFTAAAMRGEFYEEFRVHWRNSSEKSGKTQEFEARLQVLLDRCSDEVATGYPVEVCSSYELLFDLLRAIEKWDRDIVFFADEGGVWQFGINWRAVLPGYLRCLAKAVGAAEFGRRASAVIEDFGQAERGELKKLMAEAAHVRAG